MKKFSLFLILSLSLTAFLIGYLFIEEKLDSGSKSKTGTILDKFEGQTTSNSTPGTEGEPSIPFLLANRGIVSLTNSSSKNSILYYEKGTGRLFEFDFKEKSEQVVSDAILPNFISSLWSPTTSRGGKPGKKSRTTSRTSHLRKTPKASTSPRP